MIGLPGGSRFSVPVSEYHLDRSAHCRAPGTIKSLELPTLGKLKWTWGQAVLLV